jgi:Flp pilus assembly secretin CpaC
VGRAAVLSLDAPPTALSASNDRFRVQQLPPYLVLVGVRSGQGTFRLNQEGAERTVAVKVPSEGDVVGAGFTAGTTPVPLPVDHGYLLPLPDDTAGHLVVRPSLAQVVPFGERWLWVQGTNAGVTDIVVERTDHPPLLWTLSVGAEGSAPADAHPVTGSFTVPVGGTLAIDLGTAPTGQIVGHPSRVRVQEAEALDQSLELVGKKAGTTWLVTGHADGAIGVYRVEVTGG